jgi:hypothetical protein
MADEPNETDDLSELLAPPQAADTPGLRDGILRRTQRRLVFRKWTRRAGKAAALAAVFATGLGIGLWRTPPAERETVFVPTPVERVEVVTLPVPVLVPVGNASGSADPTPPVVEALTAKALELNAEQADDAPTAAKLYRQAGDAYLNAEQDYANATRCYRLFLARGGDAALTPERDDSWLLTSLKNAAFKEKVHATSTNG